MVCTARCWLNWIPPPTLDNRIEACADDIDAWEEDSLHGDDEGHQRFAARRVLVNLQLITLLHQMKAKPA